MEEECEACEEGAPAWMATFSDMATLLLTFFVLLLSFANMDIENFKMALGSVKEAFGVNMEVKGDFAARSNDLMELSDRPLTALNTPVRDQYNEVKALQRYIRKRGMQKSVSVVGAEVGIILRVKDVALFDTGSDELTSQSGPVLQLVEELFHKSSAVLSVDGHTDNVPIKRLRFPSNWELSAARAAAVLRHYVGLGLDKKRLAIAGYGELRPIAPNDTEEGRKKNRRVEFVFKRGRGKGKLRLFDLNGKKGEKNKDGEDEESEKDETKPDDDASTSENEENAKGKTDAPTKDDAAEKEIEKGPDSGEGKDTEMGEKKKDWGDGVKDGASKDPFEK